MAGTINIALTQQLDQNGNPIAGALLYFYQVGTVATPQNSYQDYGLTLVNPNPVVADQYGRIPMFYLADGQVHVRLTDASGVVIFDYPSMQVIGPSSSGSGGSTIDPTTIAATGDFKWRPTTEILTGWVKANGQTIGNPTSGASQRASSDTQNLFIYLWTNFSNAHCPVSPSRGSSALSDFNASTTIALPDLRSRRPCGLDDMGSTAAGRLLGSNVTSGSGDGVTTAAATGGEANHYLSLAEAPRGQHTLGDPGHFHYVGTNLQGVIAGGTNDIEPQNFPGFYTNFETSANSTGVYLIDNAGGGAHNNMSPFMLGTWFIKL